MEKNRNEARESLRISTAILSTEELSTLVYGEESTVRDTRFAAPDNGGVFRFFYPSDLHNPLLSDRRVYPVVTSGDHIVGMAELEEDPRHENTYWVKFISVDPKYQGQKYASALLKEIFIFASEHDYSLKISMYSEEGEQKIKGTIERLAEEYGVTLVP